MILFKEKLDYEINTQREDEQERFIILKIVIQGQLIILVNIYTPNKTKDQCTFFEENQKELAELELGENCDVITGDDFNVILDADLDGTGGKPLINESCKNIASLCLSFDLIDIYRIRNLEVRRFTWRHKKPTSVASFGFVVNHQSYSGRSGECRYHSCYKD